MADAGFYEFGPYRLDIARQRLLRDGQVVSLTPKQFALLQFFVINHGQLIDRNTLQKTIWPDAEISGNVLEVTIHAVRAALGREAGWNYIESVARRGLRFTAPVKYVEDEGPEESRASLDSEKLRALRLREGWSADQVATKAGLSAHTVRRAERGVPVTSHTLNSLAGMFRVSAHELLDRSKQQKAGLGSQKTDIVRIFVASPGDLGEERIAFRNVIDEVNKIKANGLGYLLAPLGWEDTLPGKGRPQALINDDVRNCHLFVLLLWKRWGTASGQYSSGTEEEFELARALNEASEGVPEIWLYFKGVPEYMLADPGEQLKKVLSFRTKIETERSFLYRTFDDRPQWERLFREHLCRWLEEQRPFEPTPTYISFSPEVIKSLERQANIGAAHLSPTPQMTLQAVALKLCRKAIDAAGRGRLTEAESLFASSIETLPLPETLNAYTVFLESVGKKRKADEQTYQLRDLYALRGRIDAERSSESVSAADFSCFISCSTKDGLFSDRLVADLQTHGIQCWYAPRQLRIGDDFVQRIDDAIRIAENIILVLSENSVGNSWMEGEVESALEHKSANPNVRLIPIRLDEPSMQSSTPWVAMLRRTLHIGDFRNWTDNAAYQKAFDTLLRDLGLSKRAANE